jgi:DeoR/GlpR family transcriptional regulator of sugar metabolism
MLVAGAYRELPMPSWSFLTNYGAVLALVATYPTITTKEIASRIGITERTVLRIISDLEAEGFLSRSLEGRVNRYQVNPDTPLRRPGMQDIAVKELLRIMMLQSGEPESASPD